MFFLLFSRSKIYGRSGKNDFFGFGIFWFLRILKIGQNIIFWHGFLRPGHVFWPNLEWIFGSTKPRFNIIFLGELFFRTRTKIIKSIISSIFIDSHHFSLIFIDFEWFSIISFSLGRGSWVLGLGSWVLDLWSWFLDQTGSGSDWFRFRSVPVQTAY